MMRNSQQRRSCICFEPKVTTMHSDPDSGAMASGDGFSTTVQIEAARALQSLLGTDPAPVLLWAASFALPTLVLLPATMAMGGTLAALERMMREARGGARVSAGVYGANTAGAVAGTLLSTFVLIPAFGFSGTLLCLADVNAVCALGTLALGSVADRPTPDADNAQPQPQAHTIGELRLTITLFATGLLGIAFEVLVVRLAAQVM